MPNQIPLHPTVTPGMESVAGYLSANTAVHPGVSRTSRGTPAGPHPVQRWSADRYDNSCSWAGTLNDYERDVRELQQTPGGRQQLAWRRFPSAPADGSVPGSVPAFPFPTVVRPPAQHTATDVSHGSSRSPPIPTGHTRNGGPVPYTTWDNSGGPGWTADYDSKLLNEHGETACVFCKYTWRRVDGVNRLRHEKGCPAPRGSAHSSASSASESDQAIFRNNRKDDDEEQEEEEEEDGEEMELEGGDEAGLDGFED